MHSQTGSKARKYTRFEKFPRFGYDKDGGLRMASSPCVFCKQVHDYSHDQAFEILRKTPDTLRELLDGVGLDTISVKSGTKWSPREILVHLIDTEVVYGFRFRFIM